MYRLQGTAGGPLRPPTALRVSLGGPLVATRGAWPIPWRLQKGLGGPLGAFCDSFLFKCDGRRRRRAALRVRLLLRFIYRPFYAEYGLEIASSFVDSGFGLDALIMVTTISELGPPPLSSPFTSCSTCTTSSSSSNYSSFSSSPHPAPSPSPPSPHSTLHPPPPPPRRPPPPPHPHPPPLSSSSLHLLLLLLLLFQLQSQLQLQLQLQFQVRGKNTRTQKLDTRITIIL